MSLLPGIKFTPEKAFFATNLQPVNAFSTTRVMTEIKLGAVNSVFRYHPSAGKRVSATRLLSEIKFDARKGVFPH